LRHYRYQIDEAKSDPAGKHVSLSKVPVHDWVSHAADAFRTAAVMIREPDRKKGQCFWNILISEGVVHEGQKKNIRWRQTVALNKKGRP
jgi:hypothetical protein